EQLLARLRQEDAASPAEDLPVLYPRHLLIRTWIMRASFGIAAMVAIGLGAWLLLVPPAPAYGITDIPSRMLAAKSLYVHGWHYANRAGQTIRVPIEYYVDRPNRYWHTINGIANGQLVFSGSSASDGQHYMLVDDTHRKVVTGQDQPWHAEWYVEYLMQLNLPKQMMGGRPMGFEANGTEDFGGIKARVYHRKKGSTRQVVLLNPTTGLPLKCMNYRIDPSQKEQLEFETDRIQFDAPPPSDVLSFKVPQGYAVQQTDRSVTDCRVNEVEASGDSNGRKKTLGWRFAFNINDRAILLCWKHFEESKPEADPQGPVGRKQAIGVRSISGGQEYDLYDIQVRLDRNDHPWRWSLALPRNRGVLPDGGEIRLVSEGQPPTLSVDVLPLRFDRTRMAQIIAESQRCNLEPSSPSQKVVTLEQIESMIDRLSEEGQMPATRPASTQASVQ
ncbi:MAG: hypothetical protein ACM359_22930, partial [Bacillota bacterium]